MSKRELTRSLKINKKRSVRSALRDVAAPQESPALFTDRSGSPAHLIYILETTKMLLNTKLKESHESLCNFARAIYRVI